MAVRIMAMSPIIKTMRGHPLCMLTSTKKMPVHSLQNRQEACTAINLCDCHAIQLIVASVAHSSCSSSILLHSAGPLARRWPVELRHSLANVTICARIIDCASYCVALQCLLMATPIYAPAWHILALRASIALPPKAHGNSFLAIQ